MIITIIKTITWLAGIHDFGAKGGEGRDEQELNGQHGKVKREHHGGVEPKRY
jgi:hypothetical protein